MIKKINGFMSFIFFFKVDQMFSVDTSVFIDGIKKNYSRKNLKNNFEWTNEINSVSCFDFTSLN